jgi:uncharacterized protein YndB with AHSA1/START domain
MVKREDDGIWVTLKENIAASHEEVFACLTTDAGLTRWFTLAAEVDLRKGGSMKLAFDAKFRRAFEVPILNYDPEGRVTWGWPLGVTDEVVALEWTVTPDVEAGSRVIQRHGPFPEDPDALISAANDAESWRWYLCNLRTVLEAKVDMRSERPL